MSIQLDQVSAFMAAHARVLDRRRFEAVTDDSDTAREAIIRALDAYRNDDGGYGWGLEPDLRSTESQPGGAQHALEALADAGPATSPHTTALLDWLSSVTLPDGGLPFALAVTDPAACAPFWAHANPRESSLQISAAVATQAHRVAHWDPAVKDHPWLETVTRYCFDAIRRIDETPFAYVLSFALQFLDVASDTRPEAHELLDHLGRFVPRDGALPVTGGAEGETLRPLLLAPEPGRPIRDLLDPEAVSHDLDRLERAQLADGGWTVDFTNYSAMAALEWRGYATVGAVATLRMNGHCP
ncbi:hypothetical protein [Stackebrandtia nassauensis]|uniref:Uncharacterized protein n=1 Tax=Stackebrandtia nassauensis (strain DSM 44728 / CIP 108903 / NRRL B-16338 / NBRC 102104 / LLR-40K-21) TaxID=446470 RepID=D3PUD3_STANL|nr:hypothetical protein [Stackebrandtia nassauensis]ADD42946.1 hypothetical protein Snas_3276 [Stackebrandtia nassauensis DSM 44728]